MKTTTNSNTTKTTTNSNTTKTSTNNKGTANSTADSSHDMYSACVNFRLHKNLNFQLEYRHHNNKLLATPQFNDLWFMTYVRF